MTTPYTNIPTNILFFDRSGPTRDVWYYEHPLPEGRVSTFRTARAENRRSLPYSEGPEGQEFVIVRLEVISRDVWLIAENVNGAASAAYRDPTVLVERKPPFLREQQAWLKASESQQN